MKDYILHQSEYILTHRNDIDIHLAEAHANFKKLFPTADSTWSYNKYNLFALTAPSSIFYEMYKELRNIVRGQLGDQRPLWIQAWVNYHRPEEVLDWHEHEFDYHGYISIDPKRTNTVFEGYSIENKPGQIYFGPGYRKHKVEVLEPFEGYRTTIGFDIHATPVNPLVQDYIELPFVNMSLIPLL